MADRDAAPYLKLATELSVKNANTKWMLTVLATLSNGEHRFFAKDYVGLKKKPAFQSFVVNNDDEFFTGLPESKSKSKGRMMAFTTL